MNIGNISIEKTAALAPMAGVADNAFREICVSNGAAYTVSEMVSAKGITMGDRKSDTLMTLIDRRVPCAIQLFGSEPETLAAAASRAMEHRPDIIDINMGCPVPKVTKTGAGSALMRDPDKIEKIVFAVKHEIDVPLTVKLRTGYTGDEINAPECAIAAQSGGADAVAVHGRTREQMYSPPVDIKTIAAVKKILKIPVIANGGIENASDAALMYEKTGCDLIMIGRGALGRPWIFLQVASYLKTGRIIPDPPVSYRMNVMLKHIKRILELKGDVVGISEARKHALWYTKGIRNAAEYRRKLSNITSFEELERTAYDIALNHSEE